MVLEGMWHDDAGQVVEMHGNIRQLVCVKCHSVNPLTAALLRRLKAKQKIACTACQGAPHMRCRIMLYDDAEGAALLLMHPECSPGVWTNQPPASHLFPGCLQS